MMLTMMTMNWCAEVPGAGCWGAAGAGVPGAGCRGVAGASRQMLGAWEYHIDEIS